jgi:hypothetical protein
MVVALDHSTRGWAHKKNSTNGIWNKRFFVYTKSNDPKIMGLIKSYTDDPVRNAGKPVKTYQVEFRSRSGQRFKAIDDAPGQRPNRLNVHIIDRAGGELHLAFGEDYSSIACGASLFGAILASPTSARQKTGSESKQQWINALRKSKDGGQRPAPPPSPPPVRPTPPEPPAAAKPKWSVLQKTKHHFKEQNVDVSVAAKSLGKAVFRACKCAVEALMGGPAVGSGKAV